MVPGRESSDDEEDDLERQRTPAEKHHAGMGEVKGQASHKRNSDTKWLVPFESSALVRDSVRSVFPAGQ